ncbi:MAG TPA: hypothetical protein VE093_47410 [Polyangiaceae bacterium]|jgi:hypothetical protein|nr:hypothetical protein [Polyangiaceae bacterium]
MTSPSPSQPASIDVSALSPPAQKILSPAAPQKLKEMAARGIAPGIRPAEMISVLALLAAGEPGVAAEIAEKTLSALPDQLLAGALGSDLHPAAVDALAKRYAARLDVVEKLLGMPRIHAETVAELARSGSEAVTELVATNEERLLANPRIIELLYMNKNTRVSTSDRLVDLATRNGAELSGLPAWREAATAIQGELIPEASEEPTPDDVLFKETQILSEKLSSEADEDTHVEPEPGREVVKEKFLPLYKRIAQMTMSQKVRRAVIGSREERMLLVRDANRIVASAAVRSPLMQEPEVVLIARNRNVSDEVLRVIGSSPEWMKSYAVKKNLVENPKTPPSIATRLVQHLRENDLRQLSRSKNVTGVVQEAARRHLSRRET